jgi:hypothetical protein
MGQDADQAKNSEPAAQNGPQRLVDQFRAAIRSRHYSRRTKESYWYRHRRR